MNALNPVQRVGDQIAEPIEQRLGAVARRARASGPASCSSSSASRRSAARPIPHELSGGMRQRAMIAMALACDPAIVIGDEPTTALDVMVQAQILELLERLRDELGLSLILITHDLSVIAETCDRVLIMYAGRVAEEGRVREVFAAPAPPVHPEAAVGAFPNIQADRRTLDVIPGSPPDLRTPPPGCRFHPRCAVAMDVCSRGRPARGHARRRRPGRLPPVPAGTDGVPVTRAAARTPSARPCRSCASPGRRRPPERLEQAGDGRRPAPPRGPQGPFPDPWRHRRHDPAPARRRRPRGRRDRPDHPPRRGAGPRRRVGQRQDDDRPGRSSS